jgi:hypothetical protein
MITEELRTYIDMVATEWESDQLYEMAIVFPKLHGIENVVIWVGKTPKQPGLRVKVSNIPNKMSMPDSFLIMIPSLDYDPRQVADWITTKTMNRILDWIKLNQALLNDYETGILDDTELFLNNISKV